MSVGGEPVEPPTALRQVQGERTSNIIWLDQHAIVLRARLLVRLLAISTRLPSPYRNLKIWRPETPVKWRFMI